MIRVDFGAYNGPLLKGKTMSLISRPILYIGSSIVSYAVGATFFRAVFKAIANAPESAKKLSDLTQQASDEIRAAEWDRYVDEAIRLSRP